MNDLFMLGLGSALLSELYRDTERVWLRRLVRQCQRQSQQQRRRQRGAGDGPLW